MRVSEKKKQNAVARILAGETTPEVEAQQLGVSARQVRRWVEAARQVSGMPTEEGPSDDVTPSEADAQDKPNPALKAALKAAGEDPEAKPEAKPTGPDIAAARQDMESFCLSAIGQAKSAIGSVMVTARYSPPLDLGMAKVQEALKLSPMTETVIRTNAERLFPFLTKLMAGPYQLAGALIVESLMLFMGLTSLAASRGWKAPEKKKQEQQNYKPWQQTWTAPAQSPPQVRVPEEGIQSVDASNGPFGKVADAPPMSGAA